MICAGIDAGSRAIKAVLLEYPGMRIVAGGVADQGVRQDELVESLYCRLLEQSGLTAGQIRRRVATGYGRTSIDFADATITEITCQARGIRRLLPDAKEIVDIGGQDSKFLRLNPDGGVRDFAANDRCAAGAGRFLEMAARRLDVSLEEFGHLASRSTAPAAISSMCAVFAETEIVGLLASGADPQDIASGVQRSVAHRVASLVRRDSGCPVVFTGGVAMIEGMGKALEEALGRPVTVAPNPQMTVALGAAILACRQAQEE
jgi:predicted CoA-substrate-specific enzyme activase